MAWGTVNVGTPGVDDDSSFVKNNQIGVPGGIATLDADGHLAESQRPAVDAYTKAQTDKIIVEHNADSDSHKDIRLELSSLKIALRQMQLRVDTDVTKNPFTVIFDTLENTTITGVWDKPLKRIGF